MSRKEKINLKKEGSKVDPPKIVEPAKSQRLRLFIIIFSVIFISIGIFAVQQAIAIKIKNSTALNWEQTEILFDEKYKKIQDLIQQKSTGLDTFNLKVLEQWAMMYMNQQKSIYEQKKNSDKLDEMTELLGEMDQFIKDLKSSKRVDDYWMVNPIGKPSLRK